MDISTLRPVYAKRMQIDQITNLHGDTLTRLPLCCSSIMLAWHIHEIFSAFSHVSFGHQVAIFIHNKSNLIKVFSHISVFMYMSYQRGHVSNESTLVFNCSLMLIYEALFNLAKLK